MNIATHINQTTPPLKPTDTVEFALGLLLEFRVRHLPVVDDTRTLLGVVSEEQLLETAGPDVRLETLLVGRPVSVRPETHVFDATRLMIEHDMTALPVADAEGRYVGLVRRHDIFEQFARMLSTTETGAILALEVEPRDYALSRLIYTVEQSDVRVLSVSTEPAGDHPDGKIRVTIKLNVTDAARVRHMLEHHGYHVVASFGEREDDEDFLHRIQEFMRYLEV
ncbi:MAG: acetoin utilization protein [Rhodothermaceae bacterium]|nr:MAG: acetoin utilization protein [Rhodothermaceae bacterium]